MGEHPAGVAEFGVALQRIGWVEALWVGGSAATGDHRPGVSDLDLVAVTIGPIDHERLLLLRSLHTALDAGPARGAQLGCAYVDRARVSDPDARHPTWTHGRLTERTLSGVARAELVRHGFAVFGPPPQAVLAAVTDDDVRAAARAELAGYWRTASRRSWWFLDPTLAELGFTAMARARHEIATGQLLTKTAALDHVRAPGWLADQMRRRRDGAPERSPRLRTAWYSWRDVRRTVRGSAR